MVSMGRGSSKGNFIKAQHMNRAKDGRTCLTVVVKYTIDDIKMAYESTFNPSI